MTRIQLFALTAALAASIGTPAEAQGTKMSLRPESKVTVAGSSNVHSWACNSAAIQASIEIDSTYLAHPLVMVAKPITKVAVVIPVKALKCGNGKMDSNMYKALRANEFPEIRYVLSTYTMDKAQKSDTGFSAKTFGDLTVAGKTTRVEIPITGVRKAGGTLIGTGTIKMLMTDFGIKPPVALLGTLRTKNEIEVKFQVQLDKAVVVALSQKP